MLRLAFDIASSDREGEIVDCRIPVRRFDAPQLVRHIGRDVLVFRGDESGELSFVGRAVLGGLVPDKPGLHNVLAELMAVEPFPKPVPLGGLSRTEGIPWISLPSAMFHAVIENARKTGKPPGMEEAPAAFIHDVDDEPARLPPETFAALELAVKRNYGQSCALTGLSEAGRAGPAAEHLQVVLIRPLSEGGPIHVTNCLPLIPAAAEALATGHLTIAGDFRLIVDLGQIAPELLEALNPLGRLAVPEDDALRPDRQHLAWHRRRFFSLLD